MAAFNVDEIPVPPHDAQESLAQKFYGDYVGEIINNRLPERLAYVGEPILTNKWDDAMSRLYATTRKPPIPRTYAFPKPPLDSANDDIRAFMWMAYNIYFDEVCKGGIKARTYLSSHACTWPRLIAS